MPLVADLDRFWNEVLTAGVEHFGDRRVSWWAALTAAERSSILEKIKDLAESRRDADRQNYIRRQLDALRNPPFGFDEPTARHLVKCLFGKPDAMACELWFQGWPLQEELFPSDDICKCAACPIDDLVHAPGAGWMGKLYVSLIPSHRFNDPHNNAFRNWGAALDVGGLETLTELLAGGYLQFPFRFFLSSKRAWFNLGLLLFGAAVGISLVCLVPQFWSRGRWNSLDTCVPWFAPLIPGAIVTAWILCSLWMPTWRLKRTLQDNRFSIGLVRRTGKGGFSSAYDPVDGKSYTLALFLSLYLQICRSRSGYIHGTEYASAYAALTDLVEEDLAAFTGDVTSNGSIDSVEGLANKLGICATAGFKYLVSPTVPAGAPYGPVGLLTARDLSTAISKVLTLAKISTVISKVLPLPKIRDCALRLSRCLSASAARVAAFLGSVILCILLVGAAVLCLRDRCWTKAPLQLEMPEFSHYKEAPETLMVRLASRGGFLPFTVCEYYEDGALRSRQVIVDATFVIKLRRQDKTSHPVSSERGELVVKEVLWPYSQSDYGIRVLLRVPVLLLFEAARDRDPAALRSVVQSM